MSFAPLNLPVPGSAPPAGSGPFAARMLDEDDHTDWVANGSPNVWTENRPQARASDLLLPAVAAIVQGCPTVLINGLPAARLGDATACGGKLLKPGAVRTRIGSGRGAGDKMQKCLERAASKGTPLVAQG